MTAPGKWTWQIECPVCDTRAGQHGDCDYQTFFTVECHRCGCKFEVEVAAVPEFCARPIEQRKGGDSRRVAG